ncbi:MAG: hypothetical protein M3Z24_05785 [Chloroflexota bacterium]|nr:hypothetical protein [Chloroflexota bacterium]
MTRSCDAGATGTAWSLLRSTTQRHECRHYGTGVMNAAATNSPYNSTGTV